MNEKYKQDFLRAGAIAKEVRAFGKTLIKADVSYNSVYKQIEEKIYSLGARPAFPPQMALNHVAAHFLPQPGEDVIFTNEVVKLDVGVCYEGAIGDCAVTIDLSGKHRALIDAAEEALLAAEQIVKVGLPIREIGKVIDQTITAKGFKPIKNLGGHGLGCYKIHTPPNIPNYDDGSKGVIKPGMTFAIEPFATNGKGLIFEEGFPAIFSFIAKRPLRSNLAKKLLEKILMFQGLPFATYDLTQEGLSLTEVFEALVELLKAGVIAGYGPLIEKELGMVAQAENSILVDQDGRVVVTTR